MDDVASNICQALMDGVVGTRAAESIMSGGFNLLNPRAYACSLMMRGRAFAARNQGHIVLASGGVAAGPNTRSCSISTYLRFPNCTPSTKMLC
jgi:hypothetical protein